MLTLSERAVKELNAFFADRERSAIRVYLTPPACAGQELVLALDTPDEEKDHVLEVEGFQFCVDRELMEAMQGVSIDLTPLGFEVTPAVELPALNREGSCGSCCGSCGTNH